MNLFKKIGVALVGMAMAVGVGAVVGSFQQNVKSVYASENDETKLFEVTQASDWTAGISAYNDTEWTQLGCTFTYASNNNKQWAYVKLCPGKGTSNGVRNTSTIKCNTASLSLTKRIEIDVSLFESTYVTVNSAKILVYSNSSFTTKIDEVSFSENAWTEGTMTFSPSDDYRAEHGDNWAIGSYFKFEADLTNTDSRSKPKNNGIGITKISAIEGIEASSTTCDTIVLTGIPKSNPMVGDKTQFGYEALDSEGESWAGSVVYSSSDETVGTINGEGLFTALKAGKTTISVADEDGNATDLSEASAEITVAEWTGTLTFGARYILATVTSYTDHPSVLNGLGTSTNTRGTAYEFVSNPTTDVVLVPELGNEPQTYSFKIDGSYYLSYSSSTYLYKSETKDNKSSWTVSVNDGAYAITNVDTSTRMISFNYANDSGAFGTYSGVQTAAVRLIQVTDTVVAGHFVERYMKPDIAINKDPNAAINNTGDCNSKGWYTAAKAAFFTPEVEDGQFHLTAAQRLEVKNSYADYYERLQKWALANNGEIIDVNAGETDIILSARASLTVFNTLVNESSTVTIIIVVSIVSILTIGGYFYIRRRKENN